MKRNSILVLGLGALLGFGLLTQGCGDSGGSKKKDGSADAKKDVSGDIRGTGGAIGSGGRTGTGGATGSGGAVGAGGAIGVGGATGGGGAIGVGGATGAGGRTGTGGATGSGGTTTVRFDSGLDEGAPRLDTGHLDVGSPIDTRTIDGAEDVPLNLDVPIDQPGVDVGVLDSEIDTSGLDSNID
jgi:two-component system chemotaxis sensor kinase CheA